MRGARPATRLRRTEVRLAQVFMNLLMNAAKYSEKGSRIHLHAERQGSDMLVSVKDMSRGPAAYPVNT